MKNRWSSPRNTDHGILVDSNNRIRSVRVGSWSQNVRAALARAPINWRLLGLCTAAGIIAGAILAWLNR